MGKWFREIIGRSEGIENICSEYLIVLFIVILSFVESIVLLKEFLKTEFSHENIYFWAACERYKDTKDIITRRKLASQIYQRHLSNTASEPVNVDSQAAGKITPELLCEAPANLFLQVNMSFVM